MEHQIWNVAGNFSKALNPVRDEKVTPCGVRNGTSSASGLYLGHGSLGLSQKCQSFQASLTPEGYRIPERFFPSA